MCASSLLNYLKIFKSIVFISFEKSPVYRPIHIHIYRNNICLTVHIVAFLNSPCVCECVRKGGCEQGLAFHVPFARESRIPHCKIAIMLVFFVYF